MKWKWQFCYNLNIISFNLQEVNKQESKSKASCFQLNILVRLWRWDGKFETRDRILERNWVKSFLLAIYSHLYYQILLPPPLSKSGVKLFCKHCIWKPQAWKLSRLCPKTSTKLSVHEFGFCLSSLAPPPPVNRLMTAYWSFVLF